MTVINDAAFIKNLDQAFYQSVVRVSRFGLSQKQLQSLLQALRQPRHRVLQNCEALKQVFFVRRSLGEIDAHRRRPHNQHEPGAAALTEFLAQRISRPAILTEMTYRRDLHKASGIRPSSLLHEFVLGPRRIEVNADKICLHQANHEERETQKQATASQRIAKACFDHLN